MTAVELTVDQARYLSVLAAGDIMSDVQRGITKLAGRHAGAWEALQPACEWTPLDDGEPQSADIGEMGT